MSPPFEPWAKYPDLTAERLSVIANIIRTARQAAVQLHDPEGGDNEWSLGCRAYARTCHAIREAANQYGWLAVVPEDDKPLRFTFAVGHIPVKFYHGEANETPDHYCTVTGPEAGQRQLALEIDGIEMTGHVLRLAVVTDVTREVTKVELVELISESGTPTGVYEIPFNLKPHNVVQLQSKAVDLPPLELEPLPTKEELQAAEEQQKRKKRDAN